MGNGLNFVAIDFETANRDNDSACSVGLVKVKGGKIVERKVHLIRPPTRTFVFTYVHGLTWNDVAAAPTFGELWPELTPLFDGADFIAAHNASFDQRILTGCCTSYRVKPPRLPFACSMQTARRVWGIYPSSLSDVCRRLRISLNHHEALSDALASAKIMIAASKEDSCIGDAFKVRQNKDPRSEVNA